MSKIYIDIDPREYIVTFELLGEVKGTEAYPTHTHVAKATDVFEAIKQALEALPKEISGRVVSINVESPVSLVRRRIDKHICLRSRC